MRISSSEGRSIRAIEAGGTDGLLALGAFTFGSTFFRLGRAEAGFFGLAVAMLSTWFSSSIFDFLPTLLFPIEEANLLPTPALQANSAKEIVQRNKPQVPLKPCGILSSVGRSRL